MCEGIPEFVRFSDAQSDAARAQDREVSHGWCYIEFGEVGGRGKGQS